MGSYSFTTVCAAKHHRGAFRWLRGIPLRGDTKLPAGELHMDVWIAHRLVPAHALGGTHAHVPQCVKELEACFVENVSSGLP